MNRLWLTGLLIVILIAGCSTRQSHSAYSGSTAQRLVTHSIHKFARQLSDETFDTLRHQRVLLQSHAVRDNRTLHYAHDYITRELERRFNINFVYEDPDYIIDIFFMSLGTDQDTFGLAIPIVDIFDASQRVTIDLMAVDMYHGITEGKIYVTEVSSGTVEARGRVMARVRADIVSTPVFDFPVNTMPK